MVFTSLQNGYKGKTERNDDGWVTFEYQKEDDFIKDLENVIIIKKGDSRNE